MADDLLASLEKSFDAVKPFSDEFDTAVNRMSYDYKVELGFIFSNFMYLIRALTHNDMFFSYVIAVIEKVKKAVSEI